jgi:hypothetical protein
MFPNELSKWPVTCDRPPFGGRKMIELALKVLQKTMRDLKLGDDSASIRINSDGNLYFALGLDKHEQYTSDQLAVVLSELSRPDEDYK